LPLFTITGKNLNDHATLTFSGCLRSIITQKNQIAMKKIVLLSLAIFLTLSVRSQISEIAVKSFHKVIVSPHIAVKFIEGTEEKVVIDKLSVAREKFNVEVKGKTLRIYLDDAKIVTKTVKEKSEGYSLNKPN